jgi:hypothetical protein
MRSRRPRALIQLYCKHRKEFIELAHENVTSTTGQEMTTPDNNANVRHAHGRSIWVTAFGLNTDLPAKSSVDSYASRGHDQFRDRSVKEAADCGGTFVAANVERV